MVNATVKHALLHPNAKTPAYATDGSAGADLFATEAGTVEPGERVLVGTGVAFQIPFGYEGQVRPRSGMAYRHGVHTILGTIDSDYRGEAKALLLNSSKEPYSWQVGERIAQIVFTPTLRVKLCIDVIGDTPRGVGGFGSTGK